MDENFSRSLSKYAQVALKVGLNLQPGQHLYIGAPIQTAPLVRLIAAEAYRLGAQLVDVIWEDDDLQLSRFRHAGRDTFEEVPVWKYDLQTEYAEKGDAILSVFATDPDLLKDQDPDLISKVKKATMKHREAFYRLLGRNAMPWCIISAPISSWAARVFPDASPETQEERLWDAIFDVCRIKQADPIAAWQAHIRDLQTRSRYLNAKQYKSLNMTGPGTDLSIGMPHGHLWMSGQMTTTAGINFTPNVPTEEVFTLPHRERVEGVVSATKPLSYAGALIDNFSLTFSNGKVTRAVAEKGEDVLVKMVETDAGSSRLGEVALVPFSSPISKSGLLFFNTLFDENASCHLALGRGNEFNLQNGESLTGDEFAAAGGNTSLIHVDFMFGSAEMNIDGLWEDGRKEPIMRNGEWAFDA